MADVLESILSSINSAVKLGSYVVNALDKAKKYRDGIQALVIGYKRLREIIRFQAARKHHESQMWQEALDSTQVYFRVTKKELSDLRRVAERRTPHLMPLLKASHIGEKTLILKAGLDRLQLAFYYVCGFARVRKTPLALWRELDDILQELQSSLRFDTILVVGQQAHKLKPKTRDQWNVVLKRALREVMLARFDNMAPREANAVSMQRPGLDDPKGNMDGYERVSVLRQDKWDKGVRAVTEQLRNELAVSDLSGEMEIAIERLWKPWQVNLKDIEFAKARDDFGDIVREELGRGRTGIVYKASMPLPLKHNRGKRRKAVAVKIMDRLLVDESLKADFLREVELLSTFCHPCIVEFMAHSGLATEDRLRH